MLELGGKPNGPAADGGTEDVIRDVTEATFMQEVVEASMKVPVIVDFWAPWCGPCRQLGPALESEVRRAGGKVRMAKVNVDENQAIAAQLRIQSIPTVYAFFQGQPVDGFQGAIPPSEIRAFVERLVKLAGGGGLEDAVAAAEEMLEQGAVTDAAQTFAAILAEDPENPRAHAGMARAYLAMGEVERAEKFLDEAPAKIRDAKELETVRAQIELRRQAEKAGPVEELARRLAENPDDPQLRYDYALALHAAGRVEEAVDELLELYRRHRDWNDDAAKKQLLKIFDALGPQDPVALKGRRRLSSLILA